MPLNFSKTAFTSTAPSLLFTNSIVFGTGLIPSQVLGAGAFVSDTATIISIQDDFSGNQSPLTRFYVKYANTESYYHWVDGLLVANYANYQLQTFYWFTKVSSIKTDVKVMTIAINTTAGSITLPAIEADYTLLLAMPRLFNYSA